MIKYKLSPSLFVGDLLNLEREIKTLDKAGVEMFHIDMVDTTFLPFTGLPPAILPRIREISETPFDIHLMTRVPEIYLPLLLPICKDSYISFHIETTKDINWFAEEIHKAGGYVGVALNSSTPTVSISELILSVDMVLVMLAEAGHFLNNSTVHDMVFKKVSVIRNLCDKFGRIEMILQCDMGITFEIARKLLSLGANSFVLGRDSIFSQRESLCERIGMLRSFLSTQGL